ncbi:MAG: hypothetical protein QOF15_1242, partial [Mycobacterium sp.]|nr:hypothetical protein [Mycobacterium sp.]
RIALVAEALGGGAGKCRCCRADAAATQKGVHPKLRSSVSPRAQRPSAPFVVLPAMGRVASAYAAPTDAPFVTSATRVRPRS